MTGRGSTPRRPRRRRRDRPVAGRATQHVDELRPVGVVAHRQRHPRIVVVGRVDTLAVAASPVAFTRPDDPVHRVLDHRFGGDRCADFDLGHLDQLALAGTIAMLERGEQRHPGVHTDDRVGGALHVARRTLRSSRSPPTCRRPVRCSAPSRRSPATVLRVRSPACGRRSRRGAALSVMGSPARTARPLAGEILDHDVSLLRQLVGDLAAALGGQVEGDVTLVEVGGLPERATLVPAPPPRSVVHRSSGNRPAAGWIRP